MTQGGVHGGYVCKSCSAVKNSQPRGSKHWQQHEIVRNCCLDIAGSLHHSELLAANFKDARTSVMCC
eukprot:2186599-Amphidinium_carterae.1